MSENFKDEQFLSAVEKEKVLKHWLRFLKNGLRREDFTHRLYHFIYQSCDFIAHTDIHGFFEYFFERGDDQFVFLHQFDRAKGCKTAEGWGDYWRTGSYSDLTNQMIDQAAKFLPVLYAQAKSAQRQSDLARAERLLARHGLQLSKVAQPVHSSGKSAAAAAGVQTSLF